MSIEQEILNIFEQISAIPRASKQEQRISEWLQGWAAEHGCQAQTDEAGNLVIRVSATTGYESSPTIILQGHLDMVCEKTPDSSHDFSKDPIRCIREGEWLHADNTTLGADNGIAIALALALVENSEIAHPPLELLFTVEEETGLGGAALLQRGFVNGKILLNLDSEDEGVFTVGCAGGVKSLIQLPVTYLQAQRDEKAYAIHVMGLQGGHSGGDIHKNRANANKLLARMLDAIIKKTSIRIMSVKGGSAHNAIAREAQAAILVDKKDEPELIQIFEKFGQTLRDEFADTEAGLTFRLVEDQARQAAVEGDSRKMVALLQALPHGVSKMSSAIEGLVETSNNLAVIESNDEGLRVVTSQRSMLASQLEEITRRIEAIAFLSGAQVSRSSHYPAWKPRMDSPLLNRSRTVYEHLFGEPAQVEAIHAGLECGVIGEKYEGMDMISFGPTILDPHSPQERLHIPSLMKVWELLVALLKSYTVDE